MINPKDVGDRLSELRQARGMNQQAIAALMNVTHQAVSKWETGASLPDMQTLLALSKLYHVSMEELLVGEAGRPTIRQAEGDCHAAEGMTKKQVLEEKMESPEAQMNQGAKALKEEGDEDAPRPEDLPPMSFEEISALLPYLQTQTVDAMFARASSGLRLDQMRKLAPFASEETVSQWAKENKEIFNKGTDAAGLLPFLEDEVIDQLFEEAVKEEREDSMAMLAPYASERAVAYCFVSLPANAGMGIKRMLAPFLPDGYLDALLMEKDIKGMTRSAVQPIEDVYQGLQDTQVHHNASSKSSSFLSRARRAIREDDEWLDEHAGELDVQELFGLCQSAGKEDSSGLVTLLEHAHEDVLRELLAMATSQEKWELVSLVAETLG